MKIAVRYYTRSGNTKKLAEAVAAAVGAEALDVDKPLTEKADILFLGCSYYAFDVDEHVKSFLRANSGNIGEVALFGTSAMMKSACKPVKKVTDKLGLKLRPKDFHCRGQFLKAHPGRPNDEDCAAAAQFAREIVGSLN